ncbi:MAG: HAMP domain-containing histidine kinase [Clostridium sp.]|nr:HAMP domain-containing histidine kinase [Clostridium sp.]
MIKMHSKKEFNIKYKLFLITSVLLISVAVIIYSVLYYLIPSYYEEYKYNSLEKIVDNIEDYSLENNIDIEKLKVYLYDLSRKENVMINVFDSEGKMIYGRAMDYRVPIEGSEHRDKNDNHKIPGKEEIDKERKESVDNLKPFAFKDKNNNLLGCSKYISVNIGEKEYWIDILMPLQPIDEALLVIKGLLPTILIIVFGFAVLGAYIYSIVVTKPLLKIIAMDKEQDRKRKEFIATISHELKTPITIISGQLEGMIYNIGKYKDRDTYLFKTYDTAQELRNLVEEMLEISRLDMIKEKLSLENISLDNMLNSIMSKQQYLIESKSLRLKMNIEKEINIEGEKNTLNKALNNIINNAIKYSPDNSDLLVDLFKINEAKKILIVRNVGKIDEDNINKVFKPFYRVEQSRNRLTGGSGLGLYITSKILDNHNFKYKIENDNGTVVFTVEFCK